MRTFSALLFGTLYLMFSLPAPAQAPELQARLLMRNDELWDVTLKNRRPGTTTVTVERQDRQGQIQLPLSDVAEFIFGLTEFDVAALDAAYNSYAYTNVVDGLKRKVVPYYAWCDQVSNANHLISLFTRSLYFSGNYAGALASCEQILRWTRSGTLRDEAEVFRALVYERTGRVEEFLAAQNRLPEVEGTNHVAGAVWYAGVRARLLTNDWAQAYPLVARIITERPMDYDWIGEALYHSADFHHSQTNLAVAKQILIELSTVAQESPWAVKGLDLAAAIETQAAELGITLPAPGERVASVLGNDSNAAIDYKERRDRLKELESQAQDTPPSD